MTFGQATLEDVEATRERKPIGVHLFALRGFKHHCANHEMCQRQSIQLLNHSGGRFAAQVGWLAGSMRILMRFLLVEHQLFFPPLVIQQNQFTGQILLFIKQVGDQHMLFVVSDALLHTRRNLKALYFKATDSRPVNARRGGTSRQSRPFPHGR